LAPILLSTTASYRDLCEYVQSAWTQLGLTVKVEVLPSATFREAKAEGRLAMYRASWIADYADPQNYMMLFDSRQWGPKGPNAAHVNDPLLDTYLDQAAGMQGQERLAVFEAMDAQIQSQALIIPLIYDESLRLLDKSWIGLPPHPMNALDLRRVRQVSP
jgi:peptide/nickel transport system substrate-binding protein